MFICLATGYGGCHATNFKFQSTAKETIATDSALALAETTCSSVHHNLLLHNSYGLMVVKLN